MLPPGQLSRVICECLCFGCQAGCDIQTFLGPPSPEDYKRKSQAQVHKSKFLSKRSQYHFIEHAFRNEES